MKKLFAKYPISILTLNILVIVYLFLLNMIHHDSLSNTINATWVASALLLICSLIALTHRWILKAFLILQVFIASVAIFAKYSYNIQISEDIMLSAFLNENDLTLELVSIQGLLWILLTGIIPSILIAIANIKPFTWKKNINEQLIIIFGCLSFCFLFFQLNGYQIKEQKGHIRDAHFMEDLHYFSPIDAEYNLHRGYKALKKMKKTYQNVVNMTEQHHYENTVDDLLIVFVLGETSRGDHFNINGYPRETTPLLAKIPDIYSFKNATSCDTLTINSIHCLVSPMLKSQADRQVKYSAFSDILHQLGYSTDIYSLQTLSQFYHYLKYDNLKTKYAILDEQSTGAKDISLLPYAKQAIDNYQSGKKLVILHTLGSHQTYADRFTQEQAIFTPYCTNPDVAKCKSDELINAYDNSIIAVDYLLGNIIEQLKDKKALLIYVSDHGESLGENGDYFHGKPIDIAPKEQFNIPMIFWFSDAYKQTEQGKILENALKQIYQQQKPVSHDNIFHSILGCAGVISNNGGIDADLNLCQSPIK